MGTILTLKVSKKQLKKWMERLEEAETEMNDVDNLITDLDYDIENETGEFSEEELENVFGILSGKCELIDLAYGMHVK